MAGGLVGVVFTRSCSDSQHNNKMVGYLRHDEIDRVRWDDCISHSLNRKVYAWSWYLDIVAPGWEALATRDYSSVFPLTTGRKAGLSYLYQPFFAQQLGLFSKETITVGLAEEFLTAIPSRFRYIDIQVTPEFAFFGKQYGLYPKLNHELSLSQPYEKISADYSQNTRRNIRKALDSEVSTGHNLRPEELVKLFRYNFGEKEGKLNDVHYGRMEGLINYCIKNGMGSIHAAWNVQGLLSAAAFFLSDGNRAYFLFAASAPSARENGSMFLLIDQYVREHAASMLVLDFEGGRDPNLGRFYKSFGAREVIYHQIIRNRLPLIVNAGFKLWKTMREQVKQVHL
jgi:hypothetical protein